MKSFVRTITNGRLWSSLLTHPPRLVNCVICAGVRPLIRTEPHPLPGSRCLGCGSTAVHRGLYSILASRYGADLAALAGHSVYEMSAHGALYRKLAQCAVSAGYNLTASELMDDVPAGHTRGGIRCENVEALTFPDQSFDLVTSTDVFEHVENDARGFREIARVLKPGGQFIFTVPFNEHAPTLIRGKRADDGSLVHLETPEYHGDPMRGMAVYTWRTYGTDIVERMQRGGLTGCVNMVATPGVPLCSPVIVAHVSG